MTVSRLTRPINTIRMPARQAVRAPRLSPKTGPIVVSAGLSAIEA
jgi:hypothetical protein